jgi:hypothetical protein
MGKIKRDRTVILEWIYIHIVGLLVFLAPDIL